MSDLKGELSREDQERYANGYPTSSQRRKGLFVFGGTATAAALAVAFSLPSGQEVKPRLDESLKDQEVTLINGVVRANNKVALRTSEDISKSNPNNVDWDSVITENGSLRGVKEIEITNAIITQGYNPDMDLPGEEYKPGEWINFWDSGRGQWLKISLSSKTRDYVQVEYGEKVTGYPDKDGGFITDDNSTTLAPEEIAVIELVKVDK